MRCRHAFRPSNLAGPLSLRSAMPQPNCIDLVLDAGPLLSQTPLRGIATTYYTVPQVISELRDQKAREHVERLALVAGINIQTRIPDSASMLKGT